MYLDEVCVQYVNFTFLLVFFLKFFLSETFWSNGDIIDKCLDLHVGASSNTVPLRNWGGGGSSHTTLQHTLRISLQT